MIKRILLAIIIALIFIGICYAGKYGTAKYGTDTYAGLGNPDSSMIHRAPPGIIFIFEED